VASDWQMHSGRKASPAIAALPGTSVVDAPDAGVAPPQDQSAAELRAAKPRSHGRHFVVLGRHKSSHHHHYVWYTRPALLDRHASR
jgi:hypothetical protein